ncbi:NAD(P)-binding domain-containing protein [Streptomyces sp. NPDC021096]|uniref:NAD(P)-dependent oxidoreductase n=1 Tax=Streptomyces sp. NPDC021096 TaxID=3154792 RepID=UPI0033EAE1A5
MSARHRPRGWTVGLLGAGVMAREIAPHLRAAGCRLRWYNRTADHLQAAGDDVVCSSPAAAASGAQAVLSLVADDRAAAAVWDGPQGAVGALEAGALAVECSTLTPARIEQWARSCTAAGARVVDCPLTGGRDRAHDGTLIGLAGGTETDLAAASPLLSAFTDHVIAFGPVGYGTRYKLAHNLAAAITLASVAEALALASAAGLDLRQAAETLSGFGWAAPAAQYAAPQLLDGDFTDVHCSAANLGKDLLYALATATRTGLHLPLAEAAHHQFAAVHDAAEVDMAAVTRTYTAAPPEAL